MPKRRDEPGFSRRSFLKTVGAGSVAAGVLAKGAHVDAQHVAEVGPGPVPVTLTINGRAHRLEIEPRVTLLDAVRTRANLTGNKRGCDRGACGACTMLVDGRAVYACSTLAIDVQGRQIRTVDGLASGGTLHPVQQAFCDKDALMCGFCTPGFVMRASRCSSSIRMRRPSRSGRGSTATSAAAARSLEFSRRCRA